MLEKPVCAVCGSDCTGRFWMSMLTDENNVIYYLYFDKQECVDAHQKLQNEEV